MLEPVSFNDLPALAQHLRQEWRPYRAWMFCEPSPRAALRLPRALWIAPPWGYGRRYAGARGGVPLGRRQCPRKISPNGALSIQPGAPPLDNG